MGRGSPDHFFGLVSDGEHLPGLRVDRHDRRFENDNPPPPDVNKGFGSTQINGNILEKM